jgi:hypothetical protein
MIVWYSKFGKQEIETWQYVSPVPSYFLFHITHLEHSDTRVSISSFTAIPWFLQGHPMIGGTSQYLMNFLLFLYDSLILSILPELLTRSTQVSYDLPGFMEVFMDVVHLH